MKKINHTIKNMLAVACVGMGVSACSLDMLPLNDIVLENYWKNEDDVESVVTSCYSALRENSYLTYLMVWGECRSDNTDVAGSDTPLTLQQLMKGSLKTTNTYCNWSAMYTLINRCNTVIHYAPQVHEKDPNYTESELALNIAECKTLRALAYFTLIKTFKDVPFTFTPTIDDKQELRLGSTKFEVILDKLIADLEPVKDNLPIQYGVSTPVYNTAKVTRYAAYALLAEMYLWRASDAELTPQEQNTSYRRCVELCDWIIEKKIQQMKTNQFINWQGQTVMLTDNIDANVWEDGKGYPLLSETKGAGVSYTAPYAFNAIFGEGNSFESLFEVTYHYSGVKESNGMVSDMYGRQPTGGTAVRYVMGNANLMTKQLTNEDVTYSDAKVFSVCTDFRAAAAFHYEDGDKYPIYKYSTSGLSLNNTSATGVFTFPEKTNALRSSNNMDINWIIYRLTEIMLFRAEAEIEMAGNLNKIAAAEAEEENSEGQNDSESPARRRAFVAGAELSTAEELYEDAFNIILAVYLRSNPAAYRQFPNAKPSRLRIKTHEALETLLMNERRREFLFEGKRYYDLVRQARRDGNTERFQAALTSKYGEASRAVVIKMSMLDFMYMPILKNQIQVNPNLSQNPAYAEEESVEIK